MRNVYALFLTVLFLAPGVAMAAGDAALPIARAERLDSLFSDLKRSANAGAAKQIAGKIGTVFDDSGSATVDLLMGRAAKAMAEKKFDLALDLLDQVIMLEPDFAEGWNRRATVHFMMGNFAKSMSDINATLVREPRHFGALAGMAAILRASGQEAAALGAYEQALEVYPMMRDAQTAVGEIADKLAGDGI